MLFDWFTFVAQIINFFILIWLLKRYLFKPILNAIDERESLIAQKLRDAEESKVNVKKEYEQYQQKNSEFDQHRDDLLNLAITDINSEKVKLRDQTRSEIASLRTKLKEALHNEQLNMGTEIIRRTRSEVFSVVRKTLGDLASANLEEQITHVFIKQINELNSDERELLQAALNGSADEIVVRSVFDLPIIQQDNIKNTIQLNFNILPIIKFETSSQIIGGIELITNGYKVSWNIEDYLALLEANITERLNQNIEIMI